MRKKLIFIIWGLILLVHQVSMAKQKERPFIWVTPAERVAILNKIESQPWAKEIYTDLISRLNTEIESHHSNPRQYLKEMPFNWQNATRGEIPPFHLTYHIENGIHNNLDNATEEEMRNARLLMAFLQTGIDCGIAFYLTEDEKYAQCATDILYSFLKGVLQAKLSDWRGRGGWLFPDDGFREVREIGYKVPLIYDFIAPFLVKGGKPFDFAKEMSVEFPYEELQKVFETYATITAHYGHTGSNHSILEAPSLVYNALAMDDEKDREHWLSYFLTENTENQDALNVMASIYKNEGDIWPETSQYLNGVSTRLTQLMFILDKYDPSLRLGEKYANVLFSLPALDYMGYPNGQIIRWGDGHREGSPSYASYEEAYMLGKLNGVKKITDKFGPLLVKAFKEGKYKRSGIESVLWFNDEYTGEKAIFELTRTDAVPHAGIFLQRSLSPTGRPEDGLMCFVGGAHMVHGHAEGMNIELYGKGQVLGVDNGRGSYQQDIHENYSRIYAAHNTVIVNGSSQGEGGWVNLGINTVELVAMEPMPKKEAVSSDFSYTLTRFIDDKGNQAEATQERTMALIRTSETTGYYVDVFRSKSNLPNEYHDYLYHNIGNRIEYQNKDLFLSATRDRYMANAKNPWIQNQQYRHPGWHFFKDVQTSDTYEKDVKARIFVEQLASGPVFMDIYLPGFQNREYTKVMAPHTFEAPEPYDRLPTPTLVVRNKGEAWTNPFVAVYEPFGGGSENSSISSVEKITQDGIYKGVKVISEINGEKQNQYILTLSENESFNDLALGISFTGSFSVITTNASDELVCIYLGNSKNITYKNVTLTCREIKGDVFAEWKDGKTKISFNNQFEITQK